MLTRSQFLEQNPAWSEIIRATSRKHGWGRSLIWALLKTMEMKFEACRYIDTSMIESTIPGRCQWQSSRCCRRIPGADMETCRNLLKKSSFLIAHEAFWDGWTWQCQAWISKRVSRNTALMALLYRGLKLTYTWLALSRLSYLISFL